MIKDTHGRVHDYLRISLTDHCNLRCFYCMPDETYPYAPPAAMMQADELLAIAGTFVDHGVKKIRLTGGEPLVRKDAGGIIQSLAKLPVQLTLTTNGIRLHQFVDLLEDSGIGSVNISLDTLREDRFQFITRRSAFQQVMRNIDLMIGRGFQVKINVVVMKGVNDSELTDFVAWTADTPVDVRFIEFMPFDGNRWTSNKVVSLQEMLAQIGECYDFFSLPGGYNDTAKGYQVIGHAGTFSVISTMSAPFCSTCNRMRLTADGRLKNCLFSKGETDLLTAFRKGEDIVPLVYQTIHGKARELGGQLTGAFGQLEASTIENRSMISIGG